MTRGSNSVKVRVPASTSNCGAGFDSLGLALSLYNHVTLTRIDGRDPQPEGEADRRAFEMVADTAAAFFRKTGVSPAGFAYRIEGDVPPARGLGSSVTVIAGVLGGLDALHGTNLSRHNLVEVATALEGHPDNASAGILGGFTVSRCDPQCGRYIDSVQVKVPESIAFVVASPEVELLTKESRGALPSTLPYFDAVKSINSAAYLAAAFATGNYDKLAHAVGDFMHEPYRLPKIPGGRMAIDAGIQSGALTGWLSGSGSSVLCVSRIDVANTVAANMVAAFRAEGIASITRILTADNVGLSIE
ncbi:MAG: homoserine kinase [Opitutus sp.]